MRYHDCQLIRGSLLSRSQRPFGFIFQVPQNRFVNHTILCHQSFDLAQPAISPGQMDTRLKSGGECYRRHQGLGCSLNRIQPASWQTG
jgi:hypothetical protein